MPSGVSNPNYWVEFFEFDASVVGIELPVDLALGLVAGSLPGLHLETNRRLVGDPAIEALLGQNAQFRFRHTEPTASGASTTRMDPRPRRRGLLGQGSQLAARQVRDRTG